MDESLSALTREYMLSEFDKAIKILTYNRYTEDVLIREIAELRHAMETKGIPFSNVNINMAIAIQPHIFAKLEEEQDRVANGQTVE